MAISKITGSALGKDVIMKDVATADGSSPTLTLQTGDTNIEADDVLGTINFQAPDEGTGTDAILVAAGIAAVSEGDFSSSSNATSLKFVTGNSAAAGSDGGSMILSSTGNLTLKDLRTADGSSPTITLQSGDTNMEADDVLGTINFQAPDEGTGTDAILVAAGIAAVSEGDFSSSNNATKLSFRTGASETATEKMSIASSGSTTITTTGNENTLTLKSTDADANIGPVLELNRASSSPGVNDQLGRIDIVGKNDADEDVDYVRYISQIRDETDGTEDGRMAINTIVNGAMISRLNIEPTETVFNDESNSVDFRVESNGDANCLFVDGANDKVGIGTAAPLRQLHIFNTSANSEIAFTAATNGVSSLLFGDGQTGTNVYRGYVQYNHSDDALLFASGAAEGLRLLNGGNLSKIGDSSSARIIPQSDNAGFLGENSHRWEALFAVSGTIQTSDKNMKTEITNSALGLDFVKALRPVSYKWISGGKHFEYAEDDLTKSNPTITDVAGKRNHYGLIAQEVKEVLGDTDFGGWVSEDVTDENATQSLRYDQFIAPLVKAVQELSTALDAAVSANTALTARVKTLEDA